MTQEINYEPLPNRRAGLGCYLWGVLLATIFLAAKPYRTNQFVRFHAFQSLLLFATLFLLRLFVIHRFAVIGGLIYIGFIGTWITAMITAYKGQMWKVPLIGNLAKYFAGRVTPEP